MPDIINLLSSSPEAPSKPPLQPTARKTSLSLPSLDASDIPSDFEFPSVEEAFFDKPAKKRRFSPAALPTRPTPPSKARDALDAFFSDDDLFPPKNNTGKDAPRAKTHIWNGEESDPIMFTSSAPEPTAGPATKKPSSRRTPSILLSDDDIEDINSQPVLSDPFDFLQPSKTIPGLSDKTAALLAGLDSRSQAGPTKPRSKATRATSLVPSTSKAKPRPARKTTDIISDQGSGDEPVKKAKPTRPGKLSAAEKDARAKEREAAKARREEERELEKERKQKLKEEKAKEKQLAADIAEVNKEKLDKKVSTPEMIVDMSISFEGTSVGTQVGEFMKHLGVEKTFFPSRMPNIVKWRRKITANFNEEAGRWEPCPLEIRPESHVLSFLSAQEFVDMVTEDEVSNDSRALENHVLKIQGSYPNCKRIYLIEGLTAWMRKNKNSRNRSYQAAVMRQMNQDDNANSEAPSSSQRKGRKSKKPEALPPIDEEILEDALLQLQVTHSCLIHHTTAAPESAEWIKNFTEHVSTIPYRQERMNFNDASFCMEVGQVKSGEDNADTFIKMLQEVHRLTAPIAYGITAQYPTVTALINGMKVNGPLILEDVKVSLPFFVVP